MTTDQVVLEFQKPADGHLPDVLRITWHYKVRRVQWRVLRYGEDNCIEGEDLPSWIWRTLPDFLQNTTLAEDLLTQQLRLWGLTVKRPLMPGVIMLELGG